MEGGGDGVLKPKQEKALSLMVAGNMTQREIAGIVGVTPATICNWRRDGEFQRAFSEALRENVKDMAAVALAEMVELLHSPNAMVRFMAARDLLDRAGIKHIDEQTAQAAISVPVVVITGADELEN